MCEHPQHMLPKLPVAALLFPSLHPAPHLLRPSRAIHGRHIKEVDALVEGLMHRGYGGALVYALAAAQQVGTFNVR
jgi:hypothetical protein